MKYFPDGQDYNMHTCEGRSLYAAHCDFDPIQGLIDQTKISTQATIKYFGELGRTCDRNGDWKAGVEAYDVQGIFTARVVPLAYESILLIMVSKLEEAMNTWCRAVSISNSQFQDYKDFNSRERGLEKAVDYLKKIAGIDGIKQDPHWEKVTVTSDARNMVIHNGGRVKEELRKKFDRFEIGMREEDYSLYLDYDAIQEMYHTIIDFMDSVFCIEATRERVNFND